jgi:hypothetical protein
MTYMGLIQAMRDLGFPCTYHHFVTPPTPPYTVVLHAYSSDVKADNQNYAEVGNYQLELYHTIKHPPSEKLIEDKLKELRLPYQKTETYLESEELYQIIYQVRLIGGDINGE